MLSINMKSLIRLIVSLILEIVKIYFSWKNHSSKWRTWSILSSNYVLLGELLIAAEITGLDTPKSLPSSSLESRNMKATPLSSQRSGRCRTISSGTASAAMAMSLAFPRLTYFVASFTPRATLPTLYADYNNSYIIFYCSLLANGWALLSLITICGVCYNNFSNSI